MIAFANRPQRRRTTKTAWHDEFLKMLPTIRRHARIAFHYLKPEARAEAVQEVLACALVAYVRLFELGKTDVAFPSVLARYGVAQYRDGRRVGNKMNVRDVSSPYAQRRKAINLERLDRYCNENGQWLEAIVEDKRSGPAEIAACRIDFADWLAQLSPRQRRIANVLASGETTARTAKRFRLSAARISQIRCELRQSWREFQGELPAKETDAAAA
jgi:hypothetical protein